MTAERHADQEDGQPDAVASPPCSMHEVDADFAGLSSERSGENLTRWRYSERKRLIAARMALTVAEREAHAKRVARELDTIIPRKDGTIVSLYWPFRGEPDLRPWMTRAAAAGLRTALPIVLAKGQPLVFREWWPGARMERGVWNIPYPADGAFVTPAVVVAPLVGFDAHGYRLGYGGGYFDRTLAGLNPRPIAIGVGHPVTAIASIFPQAYDIPMDWIVTGNGAPARGAKKAAINAS